MKNDVVRWNVRDVQENARKSSFSDHCYNNNTNNNNDNSQNSNNSKHVLTPLSQLSSQTSIASSIWPPSNTNTSQRSPVSGSGSEAEAEAGFRSMSGTGTRSSGIGPESRSMVMPLSSIKCDKSNENENVNEICLVQNAHRDPPSITYCSSPPSRHYRLVESSMLQQDVPLKSSSSSRQPQFPLKPIKRILLFYLQLSAVICVCNLNVGFVKGHTAAQGASAVDMTETGAPFYELDYERNGVTGNSLSGTGSNDIDGEVEGEGEMGHYTHTWAVHIPNGDSGLADEVARDHGFVNMGKIFDDHYHFAHHKVSKRSLTPASTHQLRLDDDDRVHWAKQQVAKSRQKRDFIRLRPSRTSSRAISLVDTVPLNDPKWSQMWYLNRGGGLDMNVVPAWKEGITGKGVVVTILDDGLESDHPDIEHNYDPKASYDVNSHDDDPMPHYDLTDSNRHGTRCAGEVAATANNSICAVGIAFGASVGGVRMLDGDVTDAVEARSLSLNPQHIDIYSASWGPDDDGKTVDGPGEMASRAFIEGVTKGRGGKGSIFIWASGNGGRELDNCNCDGYTNSIWTLSISSATEEGHVPWYSEKCSSTLATTYSSGGQSEKQVVTTDLHHSCTISHTGTSASAPLAAGIAALVLESNRNLTWRDLQHVVVRTAKPANLKDPTWSKNGVGRRISHSFGYGLMDAAAMVKVARNWKTVPEQQRCEINAPHVDKVIPPRGSITLQLTVKHCLSVNYLEHVQAKITLTSQRRGDIQLYLKSPAGTKVTLLTSRMHDVSRSGFNQWPFMSVHTWGESPHGNWQLEVHNEGRYMAQITQWDLIFYGTETPAQPGDPEHVNPEQFNLFGHDIEHNDIEFDASGQWRNMHQIGNSMDMPADRTNSSCVKLTVDQRCLECAAPTFLYKGHCYDECPWHTYALGGYDRRKPELVEDNNNNDFVQNIIYSNEEMVPIDRRRREPHRRRIETINDVLDGPAIRPHCEECDVTCLRCYGPLNSQCSTCFPGSQLRKMPHTNETYCYVFSERSSGNSQDGGRVGDMRGEGGRYAIMLGIASLIVIMALIACFAITGHRHPTWWSRGSANGSNGGMGSENFLTVGYDRVALLSHNDDDGEAHDPDEADEEGDVEIFVSPIGVKVFRDKPDADAAADDMTLPGVIEPITDSDDDDVHV